MAQITVAIEGNLIDKLEISKEDIEKGSKEDFINGWVKLLSTTGSA